MEKVYGANGRQDGLYRIGRNKWELIYGYGKESEADEDGWNWRKRYSRRPTLEEIKAEIVSTIKEESARLLRYGLEWRGISVEYTEERKSDLTGVLVGMQSGIVTLPTDINLGSGEDGTPTVYTFTTVEEIGSLAAEIAAHKAAVSKAEWEEINALDMEEYEIEQ